MRLSFLAVVALCVCTLAAHADTFLFTITDTETNFPNTDFTVQTTTPIGIITGQTELGSSEFTYSGNLDPQPTTLILDATNYPNTQNGSIVLPLQSPFEVATNAFSLAEYDTPGTSTVTAFNTNGDGNDEIDTLTVIDVPATAATTPEPSSVALLGTGLLGIAGMVRRRRV